MLDTLKIERRKIQQMQQHTQPDGLRLFNFREKYNLPRYKAHNAMQDAISTAELFLAQVPMGDFFKPCPSRAKAGFKKSPSG
jgi:DNA polymerase-3 subunit epsilon